MTSLVSTDIAATTDGSALWVYYQNNNREIHETQSTDSGSVWKASSGAVATSVLSSGSPITAYYVHQDADHDKKATIHVLYFDENGYLAEKVRFATGGASWSSTSPPDNVRKAPEKNSRICSGTYAGNSGWNPTGSQWAYFISHNSDSKVVVSEIRRQPNDPWHFEIVLPQNFGNSLPGTNLACSIVQGSINLFLQDHEYNITCYAHPKDTWEDKKVYIKAEDVQASTPIAAASNPSGNGKQHVIIADKAKKIQDYVDGKKVEVAPYYPGTGLGAVPQGDKVILFYKSLNPVGAIVSAHYDGSSWKTGHTVVPA